MGQRIRTWLTWAPALLLVTVALAQIWLVHTVALSPWKGGGFGMFASTDVPSARFVRVLAGKEQIRIPAELEAQRVRARDLPSDRNLRALATALAPGRTVRVEVWRRTLDLEAPAIGEVPLRALEVDGDG